jgi:membrane-associated phospholipid phosphatase
MKGRLAWKSILAACLLALSAIGATVVAFSWDVSFRAAVVEGQQPKNVWKRSAEAKFHGMVRRYADWPWLMVAGGAGFGLAWKMGNRRWMRVVAAAMIASTTAGIIANAFRLTTGRTRPRASQKIEQGFYGPWHDGRLLIGNSTYNSFPSGHTATAFGMAWPFFAAGPVAGTAALALAVLVAWSSIAIGAHHLSDVVVSIAISAFVAWLVWRWMRARGDAAAVVLLGRLRVWFARLRGHSVPGVLIFLMFV